MIRTRLAAATILALFAAGCGGGDEDTGGTPPTDTAAAPAPADTGATTPTPAATTPAQPAPAATPVRQQQAPSRPLVDEPWNPVDTGTVDPGMTRMDVIGVWGPPVAERSAGSFTYLYYRNGCEATCGTFDVVFLQDDQVVDAVVRGRGHTYSGMSSSPPDRAPEATLPGGANGTE